MVWLKGGCYVALFSAILGIWIFLVRLKGGAILCYFLLFAAILGSSATPIKIEIAACNVMHNRCSRYFWGKLGKKNNNGNVP